MSKKLTFRNAVRRSQRGFLNLQPLFNLLFRGSWKLTLKIKKLDSAAIIPSYGTEGAACFDLSSLTEGVVEPGSATAFKTGLSVEIPPGWVMMIYSRSGHGFKNGVRLSNVVGVIDSDYRGEVAVKLHNDSKEPFTVKVGDRIAQAMLERVERVTFLEVDGLSSTERGVGGFGSTGR